MTRGRLASLLLFTVLGVLAAAIRMLQFHHALIYPDGYQYLLMARGIAEHGRPLTTLGHGGDLFVPNADASLKPLFPLLVALLHLCGIPLRSAGEAVTVLAEAAEVVLVGLVACALTRSRLAGVAASALCLASAGLAFWSGFSGPDALAQALALGSVLALAGRRWTTGGAVAGLCITARPELALVALVALAVAAGRRESRAGAVSALRAAAGAVLAVLLATRPALGLPEPRLLLEVGAAAIAAALLVDLGLHRPRLTAPIGVLVTAAAIALESSAWHAPTGGRTLLETDWPLLAVGIGGLLIGLFAPALRACAFCLVVGAALLGSAYYAKNPELPRYAAELLPVLALGGAVGAAAIARAQRSVLMAAVVPAAAVAVLALAPQPRLGPDPFGQIARQLDSRSETPLLTAAPDAYGLLLAPRPVISLAAGLRGLALFDAAQRTYAPELRARGSAVARLASTGFMLRPGAPVDRKPALLVYGRVVSGPGGRKVSAAARGTGHAALPAGRRR